MSVDDCEACLLLRPTKSLILFIQSSMRCMRYKEGKTAIILDFVGNYTRHGLPDDDRKWKLTYEKIRKTDIDNTLSIRQCLKCYKVYKGTNRICPYCGNDNGKTKEQIKEEEQAQLEKIKKAQKYNRISEIYNCTTMSELVSYAKSKNYKNPSGWAYYIMKSRKDRIKNGRRLKKD